MAVSTFSPSPAERDIAAINITPLVDVMLVLLIIFMVAAPVVSHRIPLVLPQPGPQPAVPTQPIQLQVGASGDVRWNGALQPLSSLQDLMEVEVQRQADHAPLLQIDASGDADYGVVARVLAAARNAGLERVVFVQP